MRAKLLAVAVLGPLLSGCVMPPAQHAITNTQTYNEDFDTTWNHLIQYFTTHNIQIKTIEKASGVLYAERAFVVAADFASFADCGSPGLFTILGTSASLNVFVVKSGNATMVTVNTAYKQNLQFDRNLRSVDCTSTGGLEAQILAAL